MAVQKHPAWRHAADVIANDQPPPGTILPREYLADLMSIKLPEPSTPHGDAQKMELTALQHFSELRTCLGEDHQIRIDARGQLGYEVLAPKDQAQATVARRMQNIKREMRHTRREISWIPMDQLTDHERREAMEALARVGQLGTQIRRQRVSQWFLEPPKEDAP